MNLLNINGDDSKLDTNPRPVRLNYLEKDEQELSKGENAMLISVGYRKLDTKQGQNGVSNMEEENREGPSEEMSLVDINVNDSKLDIGHGRDIVNNLEEEDGEESSEELNSMNANVDCYRLCTNQGQDKVNNSEEEGRKESLEELKLMNVVNDTESCINKGQDRVREKFGVSVSDTEEDRPDNDIPKALERENNNFKVQDERPDAANEKADEERDQESVPHETKVPGMNSNQNVSPRRSHHVEENRSSDWPRKADALKNFVKAKSVLAVTSLLWRLSGKRSDVEQDLPNNEGKEDVDSLKNSKSVNFSPQKPERSVWKPLSYIKTISGADAEYKADNEDGLLEESLLPMVMKGCILLYTRLGCQECNNVRLFLHRRKLGYTEINIDIYPSRKMELEKFAGSSAVPKVFFNEELIGSWHELKELDSSGGLEDKINVLINKPPPREAPLPPLSGEDDASSNGPVDELALIVKKMKPCIVKDRFYKMRRFTNCFIGSEAVDFLSEDQFLQRPQAVEFARKLASKLFFRHVLDENLFEDGNHLYRFLDDDPIVLSQCHNIPRGFIDLKPKPITEIASRLRTLLYAMFEAYSSEDGKHVDYRRIHGSEEFARYLRIVQELHRVELENMSREEKLSFFVNLSNMMAIHAILIWGHPSGPLERRKMYGDFKYLIGGWTYSLSAIQNGILRCNQRPPYNIVKLFGPKDKRARVALPYNEPLIHFALVFGTRSGPAIRCYSPSNIDEELVEAARNFLTGGGLIVDLDAKIAYVSKILNWFGVDFGRNEVEVLKHASNYLEPSCSAALLELLADTELKVVYQPYDWGLNH